MRSSFGTAISLASIAVSVVHAHGFFTTPSVEFRTPGEDPTAFVGTIDGPAVLPAPPGMTYDHGPAESVKAFTAAFGNSSYKSLRDFVMKHETLEPSAGISKQCGRTRRQRQAQPLPDALVWQNGPGEGLTPSHEGPCEVWCDDERVFQDNNCAKSHPEIPATLPYEKAKCQGKKLMQFVWLAVHEVKWQVYTNCVPLVDGAFLNESSGSRDVEVRDGDVGSEFTTPSFSSGSHHAHNHSHSHRHTHILFRLNGSTFAELSTSDADSSTIIVPLTPKPTPAPATDGSMDDLVNDTVSVRRVLQMTQPHVDPVSKAHTVKKFLSKPGLASARRHTKTLKPTHVISTSVPKPEAHQVPVHTPGHHVHSSPSGKPTEHPRVNQPDFAAPVYGIPSAEPNVHFGVIQPDAAPANDDQAVPSAPTTHLSVKPAVHPGVNQPDVAPAHGVQGVPSGPAVHPSVKPAVHPGVNVPGVAPAHIVQGVPSAPAVHPSVKPAVHPSVQPAVHPAVNQPDVAPTHGVQGIPSIPADHPGVKPVVHYGVNEPDVAPVHGVHVASSAPAVHPGDVPAHNGPLDTSFSKATAPPAPSNAPKHGFSTPFITANKLNAANHLGEHTSETNRRQLRSSVGQGHHHHHHHRHNDSSDSSDSSDEPGNSSADAPGRKKGAMKNFRKAAWSFGSKFSSFFKNIFK